MKREIFNILFALVLVLSLSLMAALPVMAVPSTAPNAPQSPLCEGVTSPTGVTDPTPEFGWTFSDPDAGDSQGAYQILVASTSENLTADNGDMWNSGKVSSKVISSNGQVSYAGTALANNRTYHWKVKTWDSSDAEGAYCTGQEFTTDTSPPELWVDANWATSTHGDTVDSHTFGTNAFATIQDGVDAAASSGTVNVAAGIYHENVVIDKPLCLIGEGRDVVEVYSSADYVFHVTSDYVDISGFFISWGNWAGIRLDGVQHCNVFDNSLFNNTDGIDLISSSYNTIRNNSIWENWWDGIYLHQSPQNLIEDNIIYGNYNEWSCPFVYSWDGQEYRLDSHLLGREEKADYDKLE